MLRMALGPASQKTVTNKLMVSAAQLARRYPGVRLHTHLAENDVSGWGCVLASVLVKQQLT